jgi:hypothetical protein
LDCYCISGLGADERIFSRLELPGVRLRALPWLRPVSAHEPIDGYADRMRAGIDGDQPVRWRNQWSPPSLYHIHGGKDRMFPILKVQPTHIVPDGGHLMVYNRAEAVGSVLRAILG